MKNGDASPDWRPISAVPVQARSSFAKLARAKAFDLRASCAVTEQIDAEDLHKLREDYARRFRAEHGDAADASLKDEFVKGLANLPDQAATLKIEETNRPISEFVWHIFESPDLDWERAEYIHYGERFDTVLSGIQFDAARASAFGIEASDGAANKSGESQKSRKRQSVWNHWTASLAWLVYLKKVHGRLTEAELHELIADDMASKDLDEIAFSTARPVLLAVLERFRDEGMVAPED